MASARKPPVKRIRRFSEPTPELRRLVYDEETVTRALELRSARLERLESLENEVYETALAIVDAGLSFAEVTPMQQEPPDSWVSRYGQRNAEMRLEVAKQGWLPQSQVASGIKNAALVMSNIMRTRSNERRVASAQGAQLNVVLELPQPTSKEHDESEYETKVLE